MSVRKKAFAGAYKGNLQIWFWFGEELLGSLNAQGTICHAEVEVEPWNGYDTCRDFQLRQGIAITGL